MLKSPMKKFDKEIKVCNKFEWKFNAMPIKKKLPCDWKTFNH